MRFDSGLTKKDYQLMGQAGFRFLLYGLESANQKTLDRINKNMNIGQVEPVLKSAKDAGLNPHLTVMVGYPWETERDVIKTLNLARQLFVKGLADSIQATIVVPYPGTPLFAQAKKQGWLKTLDWDDYDMTKLVLKTKVSKDKIKTLVRSFYKSIFSPQFILRKAKEALLNFDVFKYYLRLGLQLPSKLADFSR